MSCTTVTRQQNLSTRGEKVKRKLKCSEQAVEYFFQEQEKEKAIALFSHTKEFKEAWQPQEGTV